MDSRVDGFVIDVLALKDGKNVTGQKEVTLPTCGQRSNSVIIDLAQPRVRK